MAMPVSAMVRKFRGEFEEVMARAAGESLDDDVRLAAVQAPAETLGAAT
jgi:hypothetical protein